ncbi:hypothetical protein A9W95_23445 [Mycobacterium sp. 1423905.2]|nr:hypothetical protein A9W95_23445 [Mycobacterium sp. 1423905.2]
MALSTPQRERYPHIAAISEQGFVDNVIQPAPDYLKQVEAYGGTGERVLKTERGICGALEASRRAAVFAGGRRQPGGDR